MISIDWFYKLKNKTMIGRRKNSGSSAAAKQVDQQLRSLSPSSSSSSSLHSGIPKKMHPPPLNMGRASYYIPRTGSWSEERFPSSPVNHKISDTKFIPETRRKSMKKRRQAQVCSASGSGRAVAFRLSDGISGVLDDGTTAKDEDYVHVPPILTKKPGVVGMIEPDFSGTGSVRRRRSLAGIQRLRTKVNTPRIIAAKSKKTTSSRSRILNRHHIRKCSPTSDNGLSASFVIVKSSVDPQREFRESMMEMIVANNITSGKDLEELLVCYLSLNSKEYHDVIVKVFRQIWFDLSNLRKR